VRPILIRALFLAITAVWLIAGPVGMTAAADQPANQPELLVDGGYEDRLHALFGGAKQDVTVVMYLASLPADARASHPVRRLLDHLIAVRKRGVAVQVLLDAGAPPDQGRPCETTAAYLAAGGVAVRWDEDTRTTHIKAVIVDGRWCVVGSTNWTFSALRSNRETSLCCDSPALAAKLTAIFNEAWAKGRPAP
jgi:phosphatidylserine/phosphatidylglycerophosphate/cardiolipin synthase-like enzyme